MLKESCLLVTLMSQQRSGDRRYLHVNRARQLINGEVLLQEIGVELPPLIAGTIHYLDVKGQRRFYADNTIFGQRTAHTQDGLASRFAPRQQLSKQRIVIGSDFYTLIPQNGQTS